MKNTFHLILIVFVLLSAGCGKKIWFYLGTGFDSEKITISRKEEKHKGYLVKDSLLISNDVVGLTYSKEIKLQKWSKNTIVIEVRDSTYEYEIHYQHPCYCDLIDRVELVCRELKKNEKFY